MDKNKFTAIPSLVRLDEATEKNMRALFRAYKADKVIREGNFDDDKWIVTDEVANYTLEFNLNEQECKEFLDYTGNSLSRLKSGLKCYLLSRFGYIALSHIRSILRELKNAINNPIDKLENNILQSSCLTAFYDFFTLLITEKNEKEFGNFLTTLDTAIENFNIKSSTSRRTLAEFQSYFLFNELLDKYWAEIEDEEEKQFWFPLWLWWHLSAIIPMRPREFVLTPRNVLTRKGDTSILHIRKNKIKGTNRRKTYKISDDYEEISYEINNNKLAKEIEWYISVTNDYLDNELHTLFRLKPHYAKFDRTAGIINRYFTTANLHTVLRLFYEEIIHKHYGYKIIYERNNEINLKDDEIQILLLGDTRHLAMINLIQEGSTPFVALILARHSSPEMSSHYFSNISKLIECKTYRQYEKTLKNRQVFAISNQYKVPQARKFITLSDNSRCYSPAAINNDFTDCCKVVGPDMQLGYCPNCIYHLNNGMSEKQKTDDAKRRIETECTILARIVELVRKGKGSQESLYNVISRLKDADLSYQQYLKEVKERI